MCSHCAPSSGIRRRPRPERVALLALGLVLAGSPARAAAVTASVPKPRPDVRLPLERPEDPQLVPSQAPVIHGTASPATVVTFGRFTHRQVNVNSIGQNVLGDAANEPSIAVDPTNHDRMVIGWRQFDTISSNFRQAGFAYTTNAGGTWTAGKIQPGVFRSDPVLGVDDAGRFLYLSLNVDGSGNITAQFFPSTDGGVTWGSQVQAFGGDKSWMTVDRTGDAGNRFVYQAWSTAGNNYFPLTFNRSTDDGVTFQAPSLIDSVVPPIWGTLDLDDNDSLYVGGMDPNTGLVIVGRSANASNSLVTPTFTVTAADLGGFIMTGGPNPLGLDGQVWIAVDHSSARRGWIYVLASVQTATDPLDVMFTRSTDGGKTFSPPVRVNDDVGQNWQWFGTMSVAPNGRIDVVWNDSRLTGDSTRTALYYSSSFNGGLTWTRNEQASPIWNCTLGYPNQQKIGDYYQMISDNLGADLAWANTFNNEEDIYYCRLTPNTTGVTPEASRVIHLKPGAPNPFTAATTIQFDVPAGGAQVKLEILDPAGHWVATLADAFMPGGSRTVRWNGTNASGRLAPSGLYFCRYQSAGSSETQKLMLIR
jgi:FlgD Ig-like domain